MCTLHQLSWGWFHFNCCTADQQLHTLSWFPARCGCAGNSIDAGVELLLLILKSKRAARTSALKCLDFATSSCPPACDRVVDQQGLKTLFAIFMGKLKARNQACTLRKGCMCVLLTFHRFNAVTEMRSLWIFLQ